MSTADLGYPKDDCHISTMARNCGYHLSEFWVVSIFGVTWATIIRFKRNGIDDFLSLYSNRIVQKLDVISSSRSAINVCSIYGAPPQHILSSRTTQPFIFQR